jgi:riboflavin kinase/FMN adenylyltransferase
VHRAHQRLLARASLLAADTDAQVVVLTFEPHPLTVVAPSKTPPRLSTLDEKLSRLAAAGAHITVVAKSEAKLLALEAERFIEEVIVGRFHPTHIVEGPSFGFGRGRKGTSELLQRSAPRFGFEVHILDPVTVRIDGGETLMVSSSLIRRLLAQGQVQQAATCLGRAYALTGKVVVGDQRGRTIGVPTANLEVADQLVPGEGVYAGRAVVNDTDHAAAISIGRAPTFDGTESRIEAHLLDFDGDLYDRSLRLEFQRKLRPQRAFDSPAALAEQLRRDIEAVRRAVGQSQSGARRGTAQVS